MRVGLVGAGGIAHAHAPAWAELGADVLVFSADGAEDLVTAYGGEVVPSYEALLERVDVVDVLTPTPTHHAYALQALEAGKHVVCEKPLARTGADADDLVRASARTGGHLFPAHVVRYFPEYVALRDAVVAGRIGRPAVLRFSRAGVFPSWSAWFGDTAQSGGVIMDQMIHDLDVARWIAGEVTEVQATLSAAGQRQTAHVVMTHADGAISHVNGVWGPPHLTFRTGFHVAGDAGVLRFDSAAAPGLRLDLGPAPTGGQTRPDPVGGESPYLTELREFSEALAGGPAPRVSAVDGAIAVELAEAALASLRAGGPVPVDTSSRAQHLSRVAGEPVRSAS